jgi:predicted metalloprotease
VKSRRSVHRSLAALACLIGVAGCGGAVERGHGTAARTSAGSTTSSSSVPPRSLCPQPSFAAAVSCISASLTTFWTAQLHRRVVETVVLHPIQDQLPPACRGVSDNRAFTCGDNLTVYLGSTQQTLITQTFPGVDRSVALAWVLGHEMGHIVQFTVHERLLELPKVTAAQSREIEQQADCLSGVWVASLVTRGTLTAGRFERDAGKLITLISDPNEARTHGRPAQRVAAIRRGLAGRTPKACHITIS